MTYPRSDRDPFLRRGQPAIYRGTLGAVVDYDGNSRSQCRNLWWWAPGGDKVMFSRRRDNVWRAFPGPAGGPGLQFLDGV